MSLCEYNPKEQFKWPKYFGCDEIERKITLQPGAIIDRFGGNYGYYFGHPSSTYVMRSLHIIKPTSACQAEYKNKIKMHKLVYRKFQVLKPFKVKTCKILHAFDNSGGGIQYRLFETSMKEMVSPKSDLEDALIPNIGEMLAYGYIIPIEVHHIPKFR